MLHQRPPLRLPPEPDDTPAPLTVVLAHGRGRSPADMTALAARLGRQDTRYVLLEADNATWYPAGFMAPFADNEPWLSAALAHVEGTVAGLLAEGVPPERLVVGGFSQGACLVSEWLARHPRRLGGVLLFTGGLIGPEGTTWAPQPALEGVPVYLASSRNDTWVPAPRVEETARWLRQSGADLWMRMFSAREHTISDEEITAGSALLARLRG